MHEHCKLLMIQPFLYLCVVKVSYVYFSDVFYNQGFSQNPWA